MLYFQALGLILLSYIAGAIPTGYVVAKRLKGIDIRQHGSGNPGTANVFRIAGPLAGAITLVVDALKGYLPVLLARKVFPDEPNLAVFCGAAAVIGHDWTIFLGFKGGKGVATSGGVFLALIPKAVACTIGVFALCYGLTRHISVGSMIGALTLPIFAWLFGASATLTAFAAVAAALIVYKHIPNIRRLAQGKELFLREKKY